MLNNRSPVPLYHQLKTALEEQIETGQWKPGDRVPSEFELGQQFRVSRTTVRQALGELVNQGLLNRVQGRGTFVAPHRIQQPLTQLTSFTQDMQGRGKKAGSKILQLEVVPAPAMVARVFSLEAGSEVIILKRLRLADEQPMAVETAYLMLPLCKDLPLEDLYTHSLYELLVGKLGIIPTRARQQMEALGCPAAEAALLNLRKGSPALHILRTTYHQWGQPFEQVESFYRGDCYIFQVELSNETNSDGGPKC